MTNRKQKHLDESWIVKANRERDRLENIKSRERLEELLDEYQVYELTADLPIINLEPISFVKEFEKGIDNREPIE
jgi:hypothetical protein